MTWEEIIEEYTSGAFTLGEALDRLAELAAINRVDTFLNKLPIMWRKEVELHIFHMYDNEIDSDDFIDFGDPEPDLALRRKHITSLREWIAKKK
jgi:hypothetical protein